MRSIAVALVLLLPAATAAWGIQGSLEPDTPHDREAGMWEASDTSPAGDRIYFNALAMTSDAWGSGASLAYGSGGVNANLVPGSRLAPPGPASFIVFLGVWKDCDRDGYVGAATTALWEYRSEVLVDPSVCPPGSDHNANGWVREFHWIRTNDTTPLPGAWTDPDTRVWGDIGKPGDAPHFDCRQLPTPRGTMRSTGGLLGYVDCQLGFRVANTLADTPLAFDDPMHPERDCDSPLNQPSPWGRLEPCEGDRHGVYERGTGEPMFVAWDCSNDKFQDVRDPTAPEGSTGSLSHSPKGGNLTDADGSYVQLAQPAPELRTTDGSAYDAIAALDRGMHGCDQRDTLGLTQPEGTTWDSAGIESKYGQSAATEGKRITDVPTNFHYLGYAQDGNARERGPATTLLRTGCVRVPEPDAATRCHGAADALDGLFRTTDTTQTLGIHALQDAQGGGWRGQVIHRPPSYMGGTVRNDLQPAGPFWTTFYARLGDATLARAIVPGEAGIYGAESCQGDTTQVVNGWDCDASRWWRPDLGGRAEFYEGSSSLAARVGFTYHLRDVDCLDGTVSPLVPVRASLVDVTEAGPCPP